MTLDDVLLIHACRCGLFNLGACENPGKCFEGGAGVTPRLDGKLELPTSGDLYRHLAYRPTHIFLADDGRPPPERFGTLVDFGGL